MFVPKPRRPAEAGVAKHNFDCRRSPRLLRPGPPLCRVGLPLSEALPDCPQGQVFEKLLLYIGPVKRLALYIVLNLRMPGVLAKLFPLRDLPRPVVGAGTSLLWFARKSGFFPQAWRAQTSLPWKNSPMSHFFQRVLTLTSAIGCHRALLPDWCAKGSIRKQRCWESMRAGRTRQRRNVVQVMWRNVEKEPLTVAHPPWQQDTSAECYPSLLCPSTMIFRAASASAQPAISVFLPSRLL
jgi:hypothetical protein